MSDFFLPVLSHFQNNNPWVSSIGRLRYRLVPTVEGEGGTLTLEVWEGPWAYQFSTVETTETFPLSQEGLDALPARLEEWAEKVNSRPPRSLEENISRRKEPKTEE